LKLQTCPEDPKDFPAYEKKVHASLWKFNMHHLLDDGTMTTADNHDVSTKLASALMLLFKTKHIIWFMGSKSTEYKDRGIEMWQYLYAKILDKDDEDEIYDKLLKPKMTADESPLDYQLTIEQALRAAKAKKLHINECQVLRAAGIGLDPARYQAVMDTYTVGEGKTFESLDQLVEVLDKFDKNPHFKASRKASPVTPSMVPKTLTTPAAPTPDPTTPAPAPTVKMLDNIRKVTKKCKCTACGGDHFINKCEFLAQLGYTITFVGQHRRDGAVRQVREITT
jgi:hypothetical protein